MNAERRFGATGVIPLMAVTVLGCTGAPVQEGESADPGAGRVEAASTLWDQARLRGVEFRAVGQEPGWTLDIDQGREIRYVGDYGDVSITFPAPDADVDSAGAMVYHARTEARELRVVIRESPCQDVMSGEAFTHSVTVVLDDREVQGCGRVLLTGELTNTYWQLVTLDGAPALGGTPQREPHVRLMEADQRVTGWTGCNLLFGEYELNGGRIRFSNLGSTRMACVDPALARQEQRFIQVLESADGAHVARDTLVMFVGGRELARFGAVYPR